MRPSPDEPTRGIERTPRPRLTRFLSREEIHRLHRTLDRDAGARPSWTRQPDIIRLLLLTGCRKSEIVNLCWQNVDGDTLDLSDSKTGGRAVLLAPSAVRLLETLPRDEDNPWGNSGKKPGSRLTDLQHPWRRIRPEPTLKTCAFTTCVTLVRQNLLTYRFY